MIRNYVRPTRSRGCCTNCLQLACTASFACQQILQASRQWIRTRENQSGGEIIRGDSIVSSRPRFKNNFQINRGSGVIPALTTLCTRHHTRAILEILGILGIHKEMRFNKTRGRGMSTPSRRHPVAIRAGGAPWQERQQTAFGVHRPDWCAAAQFRTRPPEKAYISDGVISMHLPACS